MNFDCIIANPPYAKIGCDITKNVIKQNPDSNYAMLGTRSMFRAFYADTLACAFVQIGKYELGSNVKLAWGVEQAILLATNGWTEVVDNRKKGSKNKVGVEGMSPAHKGFLTGHISHLVQMSQGKIPYAAYTNHRSATLVQMSCADTLGAAATHRRSATLVTDKDDQHLRSGYMYVAFETFEEACECAIDIISWTNPTDSHYRCVRWGFVQRLVPHERFIEQ